MQFGEFPYTYKMELDKQTQQRVSQVNSERDNAIRRLSSSNYNTVNSLNSSKSKGNLNAGAFAGGGFVVGLIVGVFVCFSNGDAIDAQINFSSSIGSAFMFWIMFGIIGGVLGLILYGLVIAAQNASNKSLDNQIASAKQSTEQKIAVERQRYEAIVAQITNEAERQYQTYLTGFNGEAQKMSVRFAESPLAVEVIEWMSDGFCRTIDAADRRSHISEINIPFMFRTYRNKIECNLGVFDFEIKRCDELTSPLEQTALTRAIASAIQLNITMRYPKDASGTNIVTNIAYDYKQDNVAATIIYTAPNGNYKATRGWAAN